MVGVCKWPKPLTEPTTYWDNKRLITMLQRAFEKMEVGFNSFNRSFQTQMMVEKEKGRHILSNKQYDSGWQHQSSKSYSSESVALYWVPDWVFDFGHSSSRWDSRHPQWSHTCLYGHSDAGWWQVPRFQLWQGSLHPKSEGHLTGFLDHVLLPSPGFGPMPNEVRKVVHRSSNMAKSERCRCFWFTTLSWIALLRSMIHSWKEGCMEAKSPDIYVWYARYSPNLPGKANIVAWMVFLKAMIQSPCDLIAFECFETQMESWNTSPRSYICLESTSVK